VNSSSYPNGYWATALARCMAWVVVGVTVGCGGRGDHPAGSGEAQWRVVYVSYVDTPQDTRGRDDFRKFRDAVAGRRGQGAISLSIEFAEVAGDGPKPIVDLMRRVISSRPDAIVASSYMVLEAAKGLTQSVPILFMSHADPVELGHVKSIAAPGVNRTGFTFYTPILAKSLELLAEAYPRVKSVGIVADSALLESPGFARELEQARSSLELRVAVFLAENQDQLAKLLSRDEARIMDAWYVPTTDVIWNDQDATLALMAESTKPVLYDRTALARKPGSMSYEARVLDPFSVWAAQLILMMDGVDPRTIPIERPSAFELAVNVEGASRSSSATPSKSIVKRADLVIGKP